MITQPDHAGISLDGMRPIAHDRFMSIGRGDDRRAGTGARPTPGRGVAGEIGGAFGDLGTFLPHAAGAITVAGLAPVGVLASFGRCYVATGLFCRLPIPVQPMKAVWAVLITSGLSAGAIAAASCSRYCTAALVHAGRADPARAPCSAAIACGDGATAQESECAWRNPHLPSPQPLRRWICQAPGSRAPWPPSNGRS